MPDCTLVVTCRIHTPIKDVLKVGDIINTPYKDYHNFFIHYATKISTHYEYFVPTMRGEQEIAKMNAEFINEYLKPYRYFEPVGYSRQDLVEMNEKYINEYANKCNTEYINKHA